MAASQHHYYVKLDTPSGIWLRFHVDLSKRAATDPLPSQRVDNAQPQPVHPDIDEKRSCSEDEHANEYTNEQYVEKILRSDIKINWTRQQA